MPFDVPLWRDDNLWDAQDLNEYEVDAITAFVDTVNRTALPVTLIDCGADIGLFTVRAAPGLVSLQRSIAIEPNPQAFPVLRDNLSRLSSNSDARHAAVGDYVGRGRLCAADYDHSDHAKFVTAATDGEVEVIRIDDLALDRAVSTILRQPGAKVYCSDSTVRMSAVD